MRNPRHRMVRSAFWWSSTGWPPAAASDRRLRDSLETAFSKGDGTCYVFIDELPTDAPTAADSRRPSGAAFLLDGRLWREHGFSTQLALRSLPDRLSRARAAAVQLQQSAGGLSGLRRFRQRDGHRHGSGRAGRGPRSIREGAIAPWNTPAYTHEFEELLALADDYGLPVDVPFAELDERQRHLIVEGVPERKFGGLRRLLSPGWNGGNTKCTCGCSSAAGGAIALARLAAARGCGPRRWRRVSAAATLPKSRR